MTFVPSLADTPALQGSPSAGGPEHSMKPTPGEHRHVLAKVLKEINENICTFPNSVEADPF